MTVRTYLALTLLASAPLIAACDGANGHVGIPLPAEGPDDGRSPELGDDLSVMFDAQIAMAAGLAQSESDHGVVVEAKYELDGDGRLSLSTYPLGAELALDSERNVFQELAGDPTTATWAPALEAFHDQEHLTVSSRDLTLVQLSTRSLRDVVGAEPGVVFWAIPTIHAGRPGYGVFSIVGDDDGSDGDGDDHATYRFVDGGGEDQRRVTDLGAGPGTGATDARGPELGDDLTVMRTATITMSQALAMVEDEYGPPIEAKFELDDSGQLSLSVYPASDLAASAEHNAFVELAGDPTGSAWQPERSTFAVPDEEHLTRAARDLTLVQTAGITLRAAVTQAEAAIPGGIVYWAIPTRRGTQSGYGIYVLDSEDQPHYLFVS